MATSARGHPSRRRASARLLRMTAGTGFRVRQKVKQMFEKNLLANKRILVTGGGSGLGAAMARRFAELGAELIICGRRLELLEQIAAQLRGEFGAKVSAIRCDIRDGASVDAMMDAIWRD